ncbi:MAG: NGG1p interacting factor NIF3 [Candidatus Omnitrophica bacterium]|nr:NGG1p interacting factor NIF3 [Candidatus Omnitrophota bacterium]
MKLSRFYDLVLRFGIDKDPRKKKKDIKSYSDSAILYGRPATEVNKIMVGIDIEGPEIMLAEKIREKQGLDLVLAHHPEGAAFAGLYGVMKLQVDTLIEAGVSESVARGLLEERIRQVERSLLPANHMRAVDAAKLLDIPFMCAHTPADNHVASFIQELMGKTRPKKTADIIDILEGIPEYAEAKKNMAGPKIIMGSPRRPVGKVFVEMTGGTEGHKDVYDKLYKAGVRTLISMHLGEEHLKNVKDANLNVVIAGHISSDTLGLNLLLDRIEKEERMEVVECSGFRRFRRN